MYVCLRGFFSARSDNLNDHYLRNYDTDLSIPQPKKEFLKRSLRYRGAVLYGTVFLTRLNLLNRFTLLKILLNLYKFL